MGDFLDGVWTDFRHPATIASWSAGWPSQEHCLRAIIQTARQSHCAQLNRRQSHAVALAAKRRRRRVTALIVPDGRGDAVALATLSRTEQPLSDNSTITEPVQNVRALQGPAFTESESRMLEAFLTTYREAIITKAREKLTNRPWPLASTSDMEHGVPLFLTQLGETLRLEGTTRPFPQTTMESSATRHGADLLARGFTVSQVVHDYGDLCQAITELAGEQGVPIDVGEFQTLNRCLDAGIADAVTEHARLTAAARSHDEVERSGQLAHEIRDVLNTAIFAFEALKRGAVAIGGNTGSVLGRSLMNLRDLVDSTLSDIRMTANHLRRERVLVTTFLHGIAAGAALHAEYRALVFIVDDMNAEIAIEVDPPLLSSAIMNLLTNAFKYTRTGGRVVLRAHGVNERVWIEVEDECGGLPDSRGDPFAPFGEQQGKDRTGLGLGLSIARKAVRAHGGDIHIRNTPGHGCVFVIDLPLAASAVSQAS
jgi:signal transduction histidine kinase